MTSHFQIQRVLIKIIVSDAYIMTHTESDLADVYARLFQVSASVADIETNMKEREQSSSDITSVNQNKL